MNSFDIAIVAVVLVFAVIGAWRGFVREVLSLLVWGVSLLFAWLLGPVVAGWPLLNSVTDTFWRELGASIVVFLVVFVSASLAALLLRKLVVGTAGPKTIDHVIGAVFGTLRGVAAVVVVIVVAGFTAVPRESWWLQSTFAPYFQTAAVWSLDLLPGDWSGRVRF